MRRIAVLAVVGAVAALGFFGYLMLARPPDYSGQGSGKVVVLVPRGADGQAIADLLATKDVVKSAQAFYEAAVADQRSAQIRPGAYKLHRHMAAAAALDALLDKRNRTEPAVTVIEGARIGQIVQAIVDNSNIERSALTALLDHPQKLGLPRSANGNPEGYLYPATYPVEPGMTALELLTTMVEQTKKVAAQLDIADRAKAVGLTYEQVLTMASIVEYEAQYDADYPKVARVLFNRLHKGMALQLDSTVTYVSKRQGDVWTTPEERADPSLYNTYRHTGLPPGPIGAAGEQAIEAVLHPAKGDWLFFFSDKKGHVVFNTTYKSHTADCQRIYGDGSCS